MICFAKLKDGEKRVEIERVGHTYVGSIDGKPFIADVRMVDGPSVMSLIIDKKCYEVIIGSAGRTTLVSTGGDEFEIEIQDELERRSTSSAAHAPDLEVEEVRAPMPGVIVSIEVEPGQEVAAGTPVIIVEAMKMQNEISTVAGGKVKQVFVRAGDIVESKQTLAVIDRV
jgi:biotin carboxyl carrier protein